MSYNANGAENIMGILGSTKQYLIPRYQRRYIWDENRWRDMADDISFIYNARVNGQKCNHFLSTFIFEKSQTKFNGVDNFNIIDGQQRLSTVMVIISAVCRLYNELGNDTNFNLYTQYLVANGTNGKYVKIDNSNNDMLVEIIAANTEYKDDINELFPVNIRKFPKRTKEEKNILKCYIYFYTYIKNLFNWDKIPTEERLEKLNIFISTVLEMQTISITVEDEQSGYDVFEILNARGTPLADHELLKNYIFKYYQPYANVDVAKDSWAKMESTINARKDIYISYFIDHYITHKYAKPTTANSVLRIVKANNERNNTKDLLEDICNKAEYYKWFIDPKLILDNDLLDNKNATEAIYSALMYFSLKNQIQFRPLFLSIFSQVEKVKQNYLDAIEDGVDNEKLKLLKKAFTDEVINAKEAIIHLQNYSLMYLGILGEPPKNIEDTIHKLAQDIESSVCKITEIKSKMKFRVSLEAFLIKFNSIGYSNKNPIFERKKSVTDIRQIMRMYELYLQGTDELTVDNMTLEHIKNDDKDDVQVVKIGNLLPLAESLQVEIGQEKDFKKKLPIYKKSSFETVKEFCKDYDNSNWDEKAIDNRTEKIAKLFYFTLLKETIITTV